MSVHGKRKRVGVKERGRKICWQMRGVRERKRERENYLPSLSCFTLSPIKLTQEQLTAILANTKVIGSTDFTIQWFSLSDNYS